ncbi:hypothetical protein [Phenylobacterium sp.]|uniref:hypothetical protein n=1 Tax=Phenylobacterium sp. TaxID=1871053 RepID=UPI003D2704A5
MRIAAADRSAPSRPVWLFLGLLLLAYAVAGNWLVLPGYRRFLAHEDAGGEVAPLALVWGAARTILWMLSFHLGAFCLAWAALRATGEAARTFRRWFALGAAAWIGVWMIPALPGPYAAFFAAIGIVIATLICAAFARAALSGEPFADARGAHWRVASAFFFALATWDICGLGSVGGILRPDSAARLANQDLVVAQTTKLIIELAIAWGLLAVAAFPANARR